MCIRDSHVSVEWLKGETDEYETDITDKRELQIRDAMGDILEQLSLIHIWTVWIGLSLAIRNKARTSIPSRLIKITGS